MPELAKRTTRKEDNGERILEDWTGVESEVELRAEGGRKICSPSRRLIVERRLLKLRKPLRARYRRALYLLRPTFQ